VDQVIERLMSEQIHLSRSQPSSSFALQELLSAQQSRVLRRVGLTDRFPGISCKGSQIIFAYSLSMFIIPTMTGRALACHLKTHQLLTTLCTMLSSTSGQDKASIPSRLEPLTSLVPNNEDILYWLTANDDFCGYFAYINRETSNSCPPISYLFICCNIFNVPCIYSDYKNNSQKLLLLTSENVILANHEDPPPCCSCCFTPTMTAQVHSWSDIKFIGSKQEYAKLQRERNPVRGTSWESAFLTEPLDLLMIAKNEETHGAMWLDYVPYRSLRVDEIKALKAQIKTRKANAKNRLQSHNSSLGSEVELSQVTVRPDEEKEAI
jgi:hypothetical protein